MDPIDLVLVGGRLWDGTTRPETALAIGVDRIAARGSDAEMMSLAGADTAVIDVAGRRIIPGLIDSHLHMVRAGLRWNIATRWDGITALEDALESIRETAATRDPGHWIAVIGGWTPGQFDESRPPSRSELDAAAPNHPVYIQRNYMEALLNTRALAELEDELSASPGVSVDADTGRVTGQAGLAAGSARLAVPRMEGQIEGSRAMLRELNRLGLTGAIDAGGFGMSPESYEAFAALRRRGESGFRTRLLVGPGSPGAEAEQLNRWMASIGPGLGDVYLRYLGAGEVLLFAAHDMEGVDDRDVSGQTEALAAVSQRMAEEGWPVHIHAILDRSVGTVLDAWERVAEEADLGALRWAITHAEQVSTRNLERIAALGIGLTIQNGMAFRGRDSIPNWGEQRVAASPPLRTILELGIPLAAGTDGTAASSYNPWTCLWWLTTGRSLDGSPPRIPQHRLTRDEALRLYTAGSAWCSFEEEYRGNLRPGSYADVAVLSSDFFGVPEEQIPAIESALTIVGGAIVHRAGV